MRPGRLDIHAYAIEGLVVTVRILDDLERLKSLEFPSQESGLGRGDPPG